MIISGVALKVLIYIALEEHEITLKKVHNHVTEEKYDINKALEELRSQSLITVKKVPEEFGHYWVYVITNEGRHLIGHLGRELRDVYIP